MLGEAEPNHIDLGSSRVERERLTRSLKRIHSKADKHAQLIAELVKANRPRNELLRQVVETVIDCHHRGGSKGPGVYWDDHSGREKGPVLRCVRAALLTAGVEERDLPSDSAIRNIAREISRAKT